MDASTLKAQIQKNDIPSFLIFTGPEWVVQNTFIDKISEVVGLNKKYVDSISDIYGTLRSRQIFMNDSLYVIRDDKEITHNEKIQEQLKHGLLGNNRLILLLTTVDKRTKFYKTYKDAIIEFSALKPAILKKYIQRAISLSDKSVEKLMEVCENDYGRCLLEIDKIKRYVEDYYNGDLGADCVEYATGMKVLRITEDKAFENLLKDGTIYQPPKDAIFDFIDAILDRDVYCFDLYEQCKAVGEANMVMLSVLYNNAKAVLQVQSCLGVGINDVTKTTGLTPWQINNARKHLNRYRDGELVNIMRLIRECEKGIKIGRYEEQFVIEYILVNVL